MFAGETKQQNIFFKYGKRNKHAECQLLIFCISFGAEGENTIMVWHLSTCLFVCNVSKISFKPGDRFYYAIIQ